MITSEVEELYLAIIYPTQRPSQLALGHYHRQRLFPPTRTKENYRYLMLPSLAISPFTFTPSRLYQILEDRKVDWNSTTNSTYHHAEFATNGTTVGQASLKGKSDEDGISKHRRAQARRGCLRYYEAACEPENHIPKLDALLSALIECKFYQPPNVDAVVQKTCELLCRLPSVPLPFKGQTAVLDCEIDQYLLLPGARSEWENLQVVAHVSTPILCQALAIMTARVVDKEDGVTESFGYGGFLLLADTIMELLEMADDLSNAANGVAEIRAWVIVRAFLWSSWQRVAMLNFWYILGLQLETGFQPLYREEMALRTLRSENPGNALSIYQDLYEIPPYMCRWAFRLMTSERAALGFDFRRFLARYSEGFPGRAPRCVMDSYGGCHQCDGSSVEKCKRFKGMKIIDQSAHAPHCKQKPACLRLYWNEGSYRAVSGARAVMLDNEPPNCRLRYCQASKSTMAISHVWSHGQGGRPDLMGTGFNICLHQRYCRIARSHGCTSYWMDTPCIPEDHQLRAEAISNINKVFSSSRITLVCDRDTMDIDLEDGTDWVQLAERLLVTLLVCDWNVRAWTLLESMRGRNQIYVLCKNDAILSVRDIIETVHGYGFIDIAILALSGRHLLPSQSPRDSEMDPIEVPEATGVLSYRHASRPGDDIVIWSLLVGVKPFYTAEDFWTTRVGMILRTGYLMSNVPRIRGIRGLSWAPSRPSFVNAVHAWEISQRSTIEWTFDGSGSAYGVITDKGFSAAWDIHDLRTLRSTDATGSGQNGRPDLSSLLTQCQTKVAADIVQQFSGEDSCVRLLRPGPHGPKNSENLSALYNGTSGGPLVAVVTSESGSLWEWRCLYEWPKDVDLPSFRVALFLLV
ncbi:MAG: hypothetical protein Q9165_004408 [Trypethelium subeluteriae]